MFTLSTKSDYGLLLLSLLNPRKARTRDRKYISLSSIVRKTNLPYAFISRIASELVRAGVLQSKEGVGGGYKLARKPKDITVAKVIEVLDGSWAPTKCSYNDNGDKRCNYKHICPMVDDWQTNLKEKMWDLLNSYSLKDLIS